MALSEQKEDHDSVKTVRRIQVFNWIMSKLQIYIEGGIDEDEMKQAKKSCLTYYIKFRIVVVYNSKK